MDVREKLVELLLQEDDVCEPSERKYCGVKGSCGYYRTADRLISNGVTVQECKVAEIGQFKLPIDDAILILKEEHKQRADGYATNLSYGGKGDPAEEVHLDALEMAIAALEWQNRTLPQPPKGGMTNAAD